MSTIDVYITNIYYNWICTDRYHIIDICHTVKYWDMFRSLIPALHWTIFTVSMFPIAKGWRHSDDAFLSHAHSQKTLVHTSDQPANPHICIIGPHACVTIMRIKSTLSTLTVVTQQICTAGVWTTVYTVLLTWSRRVCHRAEYHCSGSVHSQRPARFGHTSLEGSKSESAPCLLCSRYQAKAHQSAGWNQGGWCHLGRKFTNSDAHSC